jgi:predicted RNase H-like nuclease (RuvC/YqgF family)
MDGQLMEERISVLESKILELEREHSRLEREFADLKKQQERPAYTGPMGAPFEP